MSPRFWVLIYRVRREGQGQVWPSSALQGMHFPPRDQGLHDPGYAMRASHAVLHYSSFSSIRWRFHSRWWHWWRVDLCMNIFILFHRFFLFICSRGRLIIGIRNNHRVASLPMRTSRRSTPAPVFCRWPTLARTPTARSSSYHDNQISYNLFLIPTLWHASFVRIYLITSCLTFNCSFSLPPWRLPIWTTCTSCSARSSTAWRSFARYNYIFEIVLRMFCAFLFWFFVCCMTSITYTYLHMFQGSVRAPDLEKEINFIVSYCEFVSECCFCLPLLCAFVPTTSSRCFMLRFECVHEPVCTC